MRFSLIAVFVVGAFLGVLGVAVAQGASVVGEVVVQRDGTPNAPWEEKQICSEGVCKLIIVNSLTREVARVDGRLTSLFGTTGVGSEVVRKYPKRT